MENIRVSIEFRMPDIPEKIEEEEIEELKQARTLYPSMIVHEAMEKIMASGMEVIATQIQRGGNLCVKTDIHVPDIRH